MSDRSSTLREDKCGNCKAGKPCTGHKKDDKGAKYRLARGKDKPRGRLRRDEAPASQELSVLDYVKAAEGGFDHRSDAYIRGRLSAERVDSTGRGKACGASHIPANKKCSKQTSTSRTKRYIEPRNKAERKPLTPAQKALETRRLRSVEREILNEEASKATPRQLRKQLKENSYESWLRKNRISTKGKSVEQLNSIGRKWEKSEEGENFHRAAIALNRLNQREKGKKTVKKIGEVAAFAGLTVGANVLANRYLMRRMGL